MKPIFEEYGSIIGVVMGIVLFLVIMKLVIGNDTSSIVYQAFLNIFTQLFNSTGLSDLTGTATGMFISPTIF